MVYNTPKIRPATKNDLEKCENLLHISTMRCATGEYYTKSFLKDYLDENFFLVAENNGEITGCIFGEAVKDKGAIIWVIAISKKHRGASIGSKLLQAFEKNCKNIGIQWMILYAPQKKKKTCKFYQKHTFNKGIICVEYVKVIPKKQ